jgi:hypothetical protein
MSLETLNTVVLDSSEIPEHLLIEREEFELNGVYGYIAWTLNPPDQEDLIDLWIMSVYPELIGTDFLIGADHFNTFE